MSRGAGRASQAERVAQWQWVREGQVLPLSHRPPGVIYVSFVLYYFYCINNCSWRRVVGKRRISNGRRYGVRCWSRSNVQIGQEIQQKAMGEAIAATKTLE